MSNEKAHTQSDSDTMSKLLSLTGKAQNYAFVMAVLFNDPSKICELEKSLA